MTDRTSASIFAGMFKMLATAKKEQFPQHVDKMAQDLYASTLFYDFGDGQMDCDAALVVLGLAYKDEDGSMVYKRDAEFDPRKTR